MNSHRSPVALLRIVVLCALGALLGAQTTTPKLLFDINQTSTRYIRSSTPIGKLAGHDGNWNEHKFARVGSHVFFQAYVAGTGSELYYCSATAGSARLVADINAGANGSMPTNMLPVGNRLYFVATDGTRGYQIHEASVINGKASAMRLTSLAGTVSASSIGALFSYKGSLYFTAVLPTTGKYHIHRIDLATKRLVVITAPMTAHWETPVAMGGDYIVFEGKDTRGSEPWWLRNDRAGILIDYTSGDGRCVQPVVINQRVYFATRHATWTVREFDATNGLKTLIGLPGSWDTPMVLGTKIFFAASTATGLNRPHSVDVAASTPSLRALPHECTASAHGGVRSPVVMNGKVYYFGYSGRQSIAGSYLFESDGVTAKLIPGTRQYYTYILSAIGWHSPVVMQATKPYILFQFKNSSVGHDLFKFDGTTFARVAHIHYRTTAASHPNYITQLGDRAIFQATDGRHGYELFQSDGTLLGTTLHTNLAKESRTDGAFPRQFARLGRRVYFAANDGVNGFELWSTDGTASSGFGPGTRMELDLNPGLGSSDPKGLIGLEAHGCLLFEADDGKGGGRRLFAYTPADRKAIAVQGKIRPLGSNRDWAFKPTRGDYLVAEAWNAQTGWEPHVLNFGAKRLDLLKDTNPGIGDGLFGDPTTLLDRFYFRGWNDTMWSSKGTPATTKKEPLPTNVKVKGDSVSASARVLFTGEDASGNPGGYSWDPANKKLEKFRSVQNKYDNAFLTPFVAANKAFFVSTDGGKDNLFETDGTAANTKKVGTDTYFGFRRVWNPVDGKESRTVERGTSGETIVFGDTASGMGLFKIDDKGAFSKLGSILFSNPPEEAMPLGSERIALSVQTKNNGMEVVVTDGSKVEMVSEPLAPGSASGTVRNGGMWGMDGLLTFVGYDPRGVGAELFQWRAGALAMAYGVSTHDLLRLAASDPVIGQLLRLQITGGNPSRNAMFFFAPPEAFVLNFLNELIYIQLNFFTVMAATLNNGVGSLSFPIPNDPNLIGLGIDVQAATTGYPNALGGALTNAVNLHVGR